MHCLSSSLVGVPARLALGLAAALAAVAQSAPPSGSLRPIVHVPGLTASNLTFSGSGDILPGCMKGAAGETELVWPINATETAYQTVCTLERLALLFNQTSRTFSGVKGMGVSDFGGWDGMVYGELIKQTYESIGYTDGVNLFGAPFDWRYPSTGLEGYYVKLKALCEQAYTQSGGLAVNLMAVSYGPQIAMGFLHRMEQSWKDTYIEWFVALSPVWSGAPFTMAQLSTGGLPIVGNQTPGALCNPISCFLSKEVSAFVPALYWLAPRPGTDPYSYAEEDVIIQTPSTNYSALTFRSTSAILE